MEDSNLTNETEYDKPRLTTPRQNASRRKYIAHINVESTKDFVLEMQNLIAEAVKTGHIASSDTIIQFTTSVNGCCIGNIDGHESIIITEIKK